MWFAFAILHLASRTSLPRCARCARAPTKSMAKRRRDQSRLKEDFKGYPKGCAAPDVVPCQCNTRECQSKLVAESPRRKIHVTSKSPVGDISVVTLIRTDTTLDHSQKAEKVWSSLLEIIVSQRAKVPERCFHCKFRSNSQKHSSPIGIPRHKLRCSYTSPFMHLPLLKAC